MIYKMTVIIPDKPEMEVTKIIWTEISGFCQLSSHKRGFLSDLRLLNP